MGFLIIKLYVGHWLWIENFFYRRFAQSYSNKCYKTHWKKNVAKEVFWEESLNLFIFSLSLSLSLSLFSLSLPHSLSLHLSHTLFYLNLFYFPLHLILISIFESRFYIEVNIDWNSCVIYFLLFLNNLMILYTIDFFK